MTAKTMNKTNNIRSFSRSKTGGAVNLRQLLIQI